MRSFIFSKPTTVFCLSMAALLSSGCRDTAAEINFAVMPKELQDCQAFRISNSNGMKMNVLRCPNSTTTNTTMVGKIMQSTVVIDGVVYEPKQ